MIVIQNSEYKTRRGYIKRQLSREFSDDVYKYYDAISFDFLYFHFRPEIL